jgi:hypothetical protein
MAYETLTHQERNPLMRHPDVANQIRKKMTLGKSVLIVKVFVIDPRSKSLGKSTALNGSWQQSLSHLNIFPFLFILGISIASRFLFYIAILWGF